jgi:hypothetical protein
MIKLAKWVFVIMITFGILGFAQAAFYKYIDQDGNVQFTDNLANVPVDQRGQIDEYEEAPTRPQEPKTSEETDKEDEAGQDKGQEKALAEQTKDDTAGSALDKVGEQLRVEYEALMKEKETIEQTASQRLTPRLRKRIQADIADFNKRLADFEKRREAHNAAVEAHNAKIEQDVNTLPEKPLGN